MSKLINTSLQLARQVECAKQAGIYDAMFLAFGSLLGLVRHNGSMIPGDDDMDVSIISEMITPEQQKEYIKLIQQPTAEFPEHGLFEYRGLVNRRQDNDGHFWISIRGKPAEECFKCCHWFFWAQHGYSWHCKGPGSLVKGAPEQFISIGPEAEFLGVKIHIPKMTGAILDFWYTDWGTPRAGGNSAKKVLFTEVDWKTMTGKVVEQTCSR